MASRPSATPTVRSQIQVLWYFMVGELVPSSKILGEEVRWKLFNQDTLHTTQETEEVLRLFSQKMVDSGYNKEVRGEILSSRTKRYYRLRLMEA